jgi:hypothetical protein
MIQDVINLHDGTQPHALFQTELALKAQVKDDEGRAYACVARQVSGLAYWRQ